MIAFRFKPKFSTIIIIVFVLFTVIGTLTHELGHITAAQLLGYETKLSYGYMDYFHEGYNEDENSLLLIKMNEKYKGTPYYDLDDKIKEEYKVVFDRLEEKFPANETHDFLITLGGPTQTIITSLIGFYILYRRESKYRYTYKIIDWLGVFLGLFILREVYNTFSAAFSVVFFNGNEFYGDEFSLSRALELNQWVLPAITAIIGLLMGLYIIFKVIPLRYRFSFIIGGLVGGGLGFVIWFNYLGKIILP
jgi:hypothetical protein